MLYILITIIWSDLIWSRIFRNNFIWSQFSNQIRSGSDYIFLDHENTVGHISIFFSSIRSISAFASILYLCQFFYFSVFPKSFFCFVRSISSYFRKSSHCFPVDICFHIPTFCPFFLDSICYFFFIFSSILFNIILNLLFMFLVIFLVLFPDSNFIFFFWCRTASCSFLEDLLSCFSTKKIFYFVEIYSARSIKNPLQMGR